MTKANPKKKLIEVALPLEAINKESLHRKQKAPKGWPTSFHKWWAQRPLAACRAVIFAQMVDDPSANPDLFPTVKAQEKERQRLFGIIEDLVQWENTTNEKVVQAAQDEIWQSWRRACAEYADHPRAKELFDRKRLPAFCDPFAGSGSLPLTAQWLGLESYATDLNPVAVLINKAMIEIPPKFAGAPPVNPESRRQGQMGHSKWKGAHCLAEDVRYYGNWMRDEAERRIGHLYPKIEVTAAMAMKRPDLKPLVGRKLTVIAWLWARTVKSPDPAFAHVDVPLASTFLLSTKAGKEVYVEPVVEGNTYRFVVKIGKPSNAEAAKNGTKLARGANFRCVMSRAPIAPSYIYSEANSGRMDARLMAIVAEGVRGRVYLDPTTEQDATARTAQAEWKPEVAMTNNARWFSPPLYGLKTYGDIFTPRQLVGLTTFSDLAREARARVKEDALAAGMPDDGRTLDIGGAGATAYADALAVYLACVVDRMAYYGSSLTTWLPKDNALRDCMPRQALPMTWDFAEGNPLGKSSMDVLTCSHSVSNYLEVATTSAPAHADQHDAQTANDGSRVFLFSTDPPYYDNIGYADLSDYFYVWLRPTLKPVFPDLFATLEVPKAEELVATPYRHGSVQKAEEFFLQGMTRAMHRLAEQTHPAFPVTIYYAFKQSENDDELNTASTGWETFLEAVIRAGLSISGTWPLRTEGAGRMIAKDTNALASSIVLVCRPRSADAPVVTRRQFLNALQGPTPAERQTLEAELKRGAPPERRIEIRIRLDENIPAAIAHLQRSNIAPVDLAQAAIGPGMAVYTRYAKVLDAAGEPLPVREALALINQTLDEVLAQQEGDFDADTRWALAWFEQSGFAEDEYGVAEMLSKAKNTSVRGMEEAGILVSSRGKVRLLKPSDMPSDWDPLTDPRLTVWEIVHQLIRALESGGELKAGEVVAKLGAKADVARELAYRLFTMCERKKRAAEALSYNGLVQSWPEITRLARETVPPPAEQAAMFQKIEE
jgi:putative DNA methylase